MGTSCPRMSWLLSWRLLETHRKSDLDLNGEKGGVYLSSFPGEFSEGLGSEDTKIH